jgi:hypothetical protein
LEIRFSQDLLQETVDMIHDLVLQLQDKKTLSKNPESSQLDNIEALAIRALDLLSVEPSHKYAKCFKIYFQ